MTNKMNKMTYQEVIQKHSNSSEKYPNKLGEHTLISTIMALNIMDFPEHKGAIKASKYLKDISQKDANVIQRAFEAIQDLFSFGLVTFVPKQRVSN